MVRVDRKLFLGTQVALEEAEEALFHSGDSSTLNTSFIERHNLTICQGCSYLGRRTPCHARRKEFLEGQVALLMAYYNFLRPHRALKFGKTLRTPAMQAELAKKRLSFRDVFTSQVAFFLFFLLVLVVRYASKSQTDYAGKSLPIRVMSFNINFAVPTTPDWRERRPVLMNAIAGEDPDIIGTQEASFWQIKQIVEDLPQYDWVGLGRAGGSKDEFMAIFYKHAKFEPMAYDHFWLSDTPDVIGSRTWGHINRRMVTWARLREKSTGAEFYLWNTHFDHRIPEAREESADLLIDRLSAPEPSLPVIVTGIFNTSPRSSVHNKLLAGTNDQVRLNDAWYEAATYEGSQIGTRSNRLGPGEDSGRIDWVLASPEFLCERAEVVTHKEKGQYPSDHFPVVCDLVLRSSD